MEFPKLGDLVWTDEEPSPCVVVGVEPNSGDSVPWFGVLIESGEIHWYRPTALRPVLE